MRAFWRSIAALSGYEPSLALAIAAAQPAFELLLDDLAVYSEAELRQRQLSQRGLLTLLFQQFVRDRTAEEARAALRR